MVENWLKPYLEEFISSTGLPEDDSKELFNDFSEFFETTVISIENSLKNKDFSKLSNFAHQLKGASGSLLIEPVFNVALSIEKASKLFNEEECVANLEVLKKFII